MSRIGKKTIEIPAGVSVVLDGGKIKVKGPKGELMENTFPGIDVLVEGNSVTVLNTDESSRELKAMHGTIRALINNMIIGVSTGFTKKMQIFGTGYSVKEQGGKLILNVGYCHTVDLQMPKGVAVEIKTGATKGNEVPAEFSLSGNDKQVLGQFAAVVRSKRPPEPYKGKGIRYRDEVVRRKVGKAFGS
ncbi:MAG: 50S ribosomal protein L6 [Phycisphaerae bacterium]|jgi:large subunit ribosomal protein L6